MKKIISRLLYVLLQIITFLVMVLLLFTIQLPLWVLTGISLMEKMHGATTWGWIYVLELDLKKWGGLR